jgi:exopolysaccharide production protein ExoQ
VSKAVWLPVIWMMLAVAASRWLQANYRSAADQVDGNPIQRNIFLVLLGIGLVVLFQRKQRVIALLRVNGPLLLFFGYCLISVIWSDFPDIAFKRWIKAVGDIVMVMIIVTETNRTAAVKRFLARTAFLLIPLSVLLIQYYPYLGREWKPQDGRMVFVGVTGDKNMLGVICLLFGLGFLWMIIQQLRLDKKFRNKRKLAAHGAMLLMVFWLFARANSMSSFASFALASGLIVATSFRKFARKRTLVHVYAVGAVCLAFTALFLPDIGLVKTLGRDPTLTGRTELWHEIIPLNTNPLLGTGFESFWMGDRLDKIWAIHWWHPNEAHNGYLEVYLNLGWVGVFLLAIVIIAGYRSAVRMLAWDPEAAKLRIAFIMVGIIYAFTEAGFRLLNPVWICFLLAATALPRPIVRRAPRLATTGDEVITPQVDLSEAEAENVYR